MISNEQEMIGPSPKAFLRRLLVRGLLLSLLLGLVLGCSSLSYYTQAASGGARVLLERQPIDRLLASGDLDPGLTRKLEGILAMRDFATRRLSLPDNKSYRTYVDLGRPYVTWNVVAAPEFSVVPRVWCFPVAGCVSYRGYFKKERAERYADRLAARGWDVSVGGVTAYSTLGWFADPVLNTFVGLPEADLAGLLFHELSHQVVYAPGDTVFNESFATVVEMAGVERWLEENEKDEALWAEYKQRQEDEREVVALLLRYRERLREVYRNAALEPSTQRVQKAELFASMRDEYLERERVPWRRFFEGELDNADLASVSAYWLLVDPLERELEACDGELPCFYSRAEELAELDIDARWHELGVEQTAGR